MAIKRNKILLLIQKYPDGGFSVEQISENLAHNATHYVNLSKFGTGRIQPIKEKKQ